MAEVDQEKGTHGRAGMRALLALVLTLAGPAVYMLLLDNPRMRASGAPAFGLMAAGAVLGLTALFYDRRWRIRLVSVFNVLFFGFFIYGFFWAMALPASEALAAGMPAPAFVLTDQDGQTVALQEYQDAGPVLLVFYRGHW